MRLLQIFRCKLLHFEVPTIVNHSHRFYNFIRFYGVHVFLVHRKQIYCAKAVKNSAIHDFLLYFFGCLQKSRTPAVQLSELIKNYSITSLRCSYTATFAPIPPAGQPIYIDTNLGLSKEKQKQQQQQQQQKRTI